MLSDLFDISQFCSKVRPLTQKLQGEIEKCFSVSGGAVKGSKVHLHLRCPVGPVRGPLVGYVCAPVCSGEKGFLTLGQVLKH